MRHSVRPPMLGLLAPTHPDWVQAVQGDLDRLLADHAHCELKAAQSALSVVGRFGGEMPELIEPLLALVQEETEHFRSVEARIRQSGRTLAKPAADQYVIALRKASRCDADQFPVLLDRLLVSALVEARSCERFKLLAEHLTDMGLRAFYRELMVSEAAHYRLFSRLAEKAFGMEAVRSRFATLALREASLTEALPLGPTVHG